eukprot:superscaffoldBa00006384_g21470
MQSVLQGGELAGGTTFDKPTGKNHFIDEDEFFDPQFNCDYTSLKTLRLITEERRCMNAHVVLDKYDGNAWLGTRYRSTQRRGSGLCPTMGHQRKPGPRQKYGRGIYSTLYISEAIHYAKTFTSKKDGKKYKVILQNPINSNYRQKHNNDKYWLVPIPAGKSSRDEQEMVERAICPYGLLIKEV